MLGAAILAGVGAGLFETIDAGVDSMVKTTNRFEPDEQRHNVYVDVVRRFEDLYARIYS